MSDLDPIAFHRDDLPKLLSGDRAAIALDAAPESGAIVLQIHDSIWTYASDHGSFAVREGADPNASVHVELNEGAWSDLAQLRRTLITLELAGELSYHRGDFAAAARWEGALRALYVGIPSYNPDRVSLRDPSGGPLDLQRSFTLDDTDDDMGSFLRTAGFLHVRHVFDEEEVANFLRISSEIEASVTDDDPFTWWADRRDGSKALCRVIYANQRNAVIDSLATDPRMTRLAGFLGSPTTWFGDRMDGTAILYKPPGHLSGLANLPWHQDCGLGGHPVLCPSVSIGIQITGSSPETGCLQVVAGSQGQTVLPLLDEIAMVGWPLVSVSTSPGDVTVHISDLVHASPAPVGEGGRRTMYLTYHPPALGDVIGPGEAVNDFIRGRQDQAGALAGRSASKGS